MTPQDPQGRGDAFLRGLQAGRLSGWVRSGARIGYEQDYGSNWPGAAASVAAAGKGVVEAPMHLVRGLQWLTEKATGQDFEDVPTDIRSVLPENMALRMESRLSRAYARGASEIGGGLLTLPAGGGSGLVGKLFSTPGQFIKLAGAPAVKLGEKVLANAPRMGKLGEIAAKHVPQLAGSATGFGLYGFLAEEGGTEERFAALQHGMLTGAAMHVLGTAGRAAEESILSFGKGLAEKRAAKSLLDGMKAGKVDPSLMWKVGGRAVSSAIEATGFAGLSRDFWTDLAAGANGDEAAMGRAMEVWAMSLGAVLLAKTGDVNALSWFRRNAPEVNTLETRLLSEGIRNPQEPRAQEPKPEVPPEVKLLGQGPGPEAPGPTAAETAYRLPALQQVSDPLFKSGWDLKPGVETDGTKQWITMEFPGAGKIRMWEDEGATGKAVEGFGLSVPADVFRIVRGDVALPEGSSEVRMVGEVAREFARDLAAVSMLRRIRGELFFGGNGEAWAGGPWRDLEGGPYHTIGLDGKHYRQGVFSEDGFTVEADPTLPRVDNQMAQDPQIARWIELAQSLRHNTAPNPGLDLLEASLALVVNGDPRSTSLQEVAKLLAMPWQEGAMNADLAANLLRPGNIEQFGMTIGQVAAGHLTAEAAAQQIGTALVGAQAEGGALPAPEAEAQPQGSIAGSRDWSEATPQERREAARQHVASGGKETSTELGATFMIPRETARDIRGESRESEAGFALGGAVVDAAAAGAKAVAKVAQGGYDKLVRSQLDVLAKKGGAAGQRLSKEFREAITRGRHLRGVAGERAKAGLRAARGLSGREEPATAPGGQYPSLRWRNLVEGTAQNPTAAETTFGDRLNEALLTMQHSAFGAGAMFMGRGGWQPAARMKRARVPYQYSSDPERGYFAMLENPAARQAFYRELERLDPAVNAAQMEADFQTRLGGRKITDPESIAAFERQRQIQHMPSTFAHGGKTWEILEPDPAVAMHNIVERQGGRVGLMQVVGQDLPPDVRQQFGIQRPGITERLAEFGRELSQTETKNQAELVKTATDIAERIQGREPHPLGDVGRAIREILAIPRALQVFTSGVYDGPAMLTETVPYIGVRRTIRALWSFLVSRGAVRDAQQFGSLAHELGSLDLGTSNTLARRVADMVLAPSNMLERWKTAFFDRAAKLWVDSIRIRPHAGDKHTLIDILGFSEADATAMVNGTAAQILYDQARRELVVRMANRARLEERSAAAASPTFRNWVRYTGYATKRMEQLANDVAGLKRVWGKGSTPAERAAAVQRVVYRATGMPIAGIAGLALGYMLMEAFRGENGLERLQREMMYYPLQTGWKAIRSQIAAGPFSSLVSAAEGEPEAMFNIVEGMGAAKSAIEAWQRSGGNVVDVLAESGKAIGIYPRQLSDVITTAQTLYTGRHDFVDLARAVSQWKHLEGVDFQGGDRNKPDEFYNAIAKAREKIQARLEAGEETPDVLPDLQEALGVETGEAVADKLRSSRFVHGLSDEQRLKLFEFLGQEKEDLAIAHDEAMLATARAVQKQAGTYPREWGEVLDTARGLAMKGASNAWGKAMERAIEEDVVRRLSQVQPDSDIDELAMEMAEYPLALQNEAGIGEVDKEVLARKKGLSGGDRLARSRYIGHMLRRRAMDRTIEAKIEAAKERRKDR